MKSKARYVIALALALALVLALGGCAPAEETEKPTEVPDTIKIGVHTSLTGGLADYGFAAQEGIKVANAAKPTVMVGDKEVKVEIVIVDDKGEPAESPIVAQSLVDQGVVAVIGALTSGNTNAAGPIYSDAGIPQISGSATLASLTTKGWSAFFRTCVGDSLQGAALAEWVKEKGYKKVVLFDDSGDYAVGLADVVEENLEGTDVTVSREAAKEGDTDFSAQIANIKAAGAEAVVYTGYHKECGLLRKQMVEAGLGDVQILGGDGIKSDDIVGEAGGAENAKGMLATFGGVNTADMAEFEAFKTAYMAANPDKEPGPYAETNHDAYMAIIAAIESAGSVEPADIGAALKTVEVDGVIGSFGFTETGEVKLVGESEAIKTIYRYMCDGKTWVEAE